VSFAGVESGEITRLEGGKLDAEAGGPPPDIRMLLEGVDHRD